MSARTLPALAVLAALGATGRLGVAAAGLVCALALHLRPHHGSPLLRWTASAALVGAATVQLVAPTGTIAPPAPAVWAVAAVAATLLLGHLGRWHVAEGIADAAIAVGVLVTLTATGAAPGADALQPRELLALAGITWVTAVWGRAAFLSGRVTVAGGSTFTALVCAASSAAIGAGAPGPTWLRGLLLSTAYVAVVIGLRHPSVRDLLQVPAGPLTPLPRSLVLSTVTVAGTGVGALRVAQVEGLGRPAAALMVLTAAVLTHRVLSSQRDRRAAEAALHEQRSLDPRTGLPTAGFLTGELARTAGRRRHLDLLLVRVEPLRSMLRSLPPTAAAELLAVLSSRIADVAGRDATVGRGDEDEFLVVTRSGADALGHALLEALRTPLPLAGAATVEVRAAIAVVDAFAPSDLAGAIDRARYAVARGGTSRGLHRYDREMATEQDRVATVTATLPEALATGAVEPWFQPIVEVATGHIRGFELLARWFDGELGPVAPSEFIPVAEATGVITGLGRTLITTACVQVQRWRHLPHCEELYLTVNLSARQLQNRPETWLLPALDASGLPASALVIELTEGAFLDIDDAQVGVTLDALRAAGVRLAIDDFGTGYSSLAYLQQFRPDIVKVDRSFTARLGRPDDEVAERVFAMVRDLGWEVVAEGIEEPATVAALDALSCRYGQGWLWSAALRADDATALLVDSCTGHRRSPAVEPDSVVDLAAVERELQGTDGEQHRPRPER